MAKLTFYNALGRGAQMVAPTYTLVPRTRTPVADGMMSITNRGSVYTGTQSFDNGALHAATSFTALNSSITYVRVDMVKYFNGRRRPIVTLTGINQTVSISGFYSVTVDGWLEGSDVVVGNRYSEVLYSGKGSDTVYGNAGNDTLDGDDGNDRLYGGAGRDILIGGNGTDRLFGGTGADRFRILSRSHAGDVIGDFNVRYDRVELSRWSYGFGELAAGFLTRSRFQSLASSSTATRANVRFIFNRANRTLYYDPDGSGAAAPEKVVTLGGRASMNASSIILV